ncbi:MAG: hypothetical protein GC161_03670 [Planctomycetaceae bacterium]|nr:hypothetical protein [Planctomycetaceae bacterium]
MSFHRSPGAHARPSRGGLNPTLQVLLPAPSRARAGLGVPVALGLGLLAGCGSDSDSGGGAPAFSGPMAVLSCSLGCSGTPATGLGCSVSEVFVNQDVWVEFSQAVDAASVNKNTFQVIDAVTGATPAGIYLVDPNNPRRVAFRPQLGFDSSGNPTFGLAPGSSYRISLPASSGLAIQSVSGQANQSPLQCFVQASLGVNDVVPGAPSVEAFLDTEVGGTPMAISANGAQDVPLETGLRLEFDDLMNPATLVNPATGQSDTLAVLIDLDGQLESEGDRIPLQGDFQILLDSDLNRTTVLFQPTNGFPSAGNQLDGLGNAAPRRIVVEIPSLVSDIAGNSLANAGDVVFTTISLVFPPLDLPYGDGEDFSSTELIDSQRTGAIVEITQTGPGQLEGRALPGLGGGSGRFGDVRVPGGETLVLGVDALGSSFGPGVTTDLSQGDIQGYVVDNYDSALGELPGEVDFTAADGLYEFSSLVMDPGSVLRFAGPLSPRIYVRGDLRLDGVAFLTGTTPADQVSSDGFADEPPAGAAGSGGGGRGADRSNQTGTGLQALGGFAHGIGVPVELDGAAGEGRGGLPNAGEGQGGSRWPLVFPGPTPQDLGGFIPSFAIVCESKQVGAPGGGGSFGTQGGPGAWANLSSGPAAQPPPPPTALGGASVLRADSTTLDPDAGLLVGGAGGGGGGAGIGLSRLLAIPNNCSVAVGTQPIGLLNFVDHSGSAGGSGGGAMQFQVGGTAAIAGNIDLSGGRGGRSIPVSGLAQNGVQAAPGGGGSGGALLLQAYDLNLAQIPGLIDVRGGAGGATVLTTSRGGDGGAGVVRIETRADTPFSAASEAAKVLPVTGGPDQPALGEVLFLTEWNAKDTGVGARSGLQSCWLIPDGSVFEVDYDEDDLAAPGGPIFGWNMELELAGGIIAQFRGESPSLPQLGTDLETLFGGDLGSSPVVVRFQGARVLAGLADPCFDSSLQPGSEFLAGSLTPWVRHPAELNGYWDLVLPQDPGLAAQRKPNVIRYQVIFDRSIVIDNLPVVALRSLRIGCQPD